MSTVGLLLAAGAGRRMGRPKALVRPAPDRPTLLESAVGHLRDAGVDRVVVVVGAAAEDAASLADRAGAEVVVAGDWQEGMGASLRAGLRHLAEEDPANGRTDAAVVTLVDLPDVGPAVHRRVLAAVEDPVEALVRATYDGAPGHPVVIGRAHWEGVTTSARGDRGARDHLAAHATTLVECGDLATGADVDTPSALGH